ncbi:MAG: hypothetical protein E7066_10500 [Lentimicrobiaceae bacterium]|nr:hypothetical protein [Lentimicrobiaceae bacterium]
MYRQSTNGYIADLMKILISQNEREHRASDALSKAHTLYTAGQIMDRRARLANLASLVSCGMLPTSPEEKQQIMEICHHQISECDKVLQKMEEGAIKDEVKYSN